MLKIFIDKDNNYYHPVKFTLELILNNKSVSFLFAQNKLEADLIIGTGLKDHVRINQEFYNRLDNGIYNHNIHFENDHFITHTNGDKDLISTIFYMVNCLQEYNAKNHEMDKFGRFSYFHSYQYKYACIQENIVQQIINELFNDITPLKRLKLENPKRSMIFLSHDIDLLHGGWKSEILWSIKRFKFWPALRILVKKISGIGPWNTINDLMDIHDKYKLKSTFFWIPKQGEDEFKIKNADYNIKSSELNQLTQHISKRGFHNGIHKSSLNSTLIDELKLLPFQTNINRYHYLKFQIPKAWHEIEAAGLKYDSSLMYAEQIGFRNSYGQPFQPYNFKTKQAFRFQEIPLHIMPGSIFYNKSEETDQILPSILSFIEKNKLESVISILWHNNEFSDYQFYKYKKIYQNILTYNLKHRLDQFEL